MTKAEELALCEQTKERNLRYIRAKIVHATAKELELIAAFIEGLGVVGWSDTEYNRPIREEAPEVKV